MNGLSVENPYVELLGFHIPVSIFLQHILRCLPFEEIICSSIVTKAWRAILRDQNNTKAIKPIIIDFSKMRTKSVKKFEQVLKEYQPNYLVLPKQGYTQEKLIKNLDIMKGLSDLRGIKFDINRDNYQILVDSISQPTKITSLGKLHIELFSDEKMNELTSIIDKFPNVTSLSIVFYYKEEWQAWNEPDISVRRRRTVKEMLCKILKLMTDKWPKLKVLEVQYGFNEYKNDWMIKNQLHPNQRIGPSGNFFETFVMQFKKLKILKLGKNVAESMINAEMKPDYWRAIFPLLEEVHFISTKFPHEKFIRFLIDIKHLKKFHIALTINPLPNSWQNTHAASREARMQLALFCCRGGTWTTNIQKLKHLEDMSTMRDFKDEFNAMKQEIKTLRQQAHENQENAIPYTNNRATENGSSMMMMMTPGNPLDLRSATTSNFTSGNNRFNNFGRGSSSTNTNNMMMMPMHDTNFSNSNLRSRGSNGNSSNNNMMMMMPMHNNP